MVAEATMPRIGLAFMIDRAITICTLGVLLAGQLYALCGLYLVDRPAFDKAVIPYKTDNHPVDTISGCLGGDSLVKDLIRTPANPREEAFRSDILTGVESRSLQAYAQYIDQGFYDTDGNAIKIRR